MYDGIVIGGGPAGMLASIIAAQRGNKVLVLERNERLGKKLLITGKGRCNVTNACSAQEVLQNIPRNGRFLFSAMENFPPSSIMDFLESHLGDDPDDKTVKRTIDALLRRGHSYSNIRKAMQEMAMQIQEFPED